MKKLITVHATGTEANVNLKLADLDRQDRQHGFARVGYHYVITRDGVIEDGRAESEASLHDDISIARQAISVCLVGGAGMVPNNFTDVQWDALAQLLLRIQEDHPKSEIRVVTPALTLEYVVGMYQKKLSQQGSYRFN